MLNTLLSGDVTDPQFPEHLIKETINAFGQLDILVNNAGMSDSSGKSKSS